MAGSAFVTCAIAAALMIRQGRMMRAAMWAVGSVILVWMTRSVLATALGLTA